MNQPLKESDEAIIRQIVQDMKRRQNAKKNHCERCKYYNQSDDYCYFWCDNADGINLYRFTCFVEKKSD